MKPGIKSEIKEKIYSFYRGIFTEILNTAGIKSYNQFISLWRDFQKIHSDAVGSLLTEYVENFTSEGIIIEKIEAQSVVIEIVDNETGMLYRRNLPLKYLETDNGIILSGENSNGKQSDITFLSDTALGRINDLTGKGPDSSRCGH